MLYVARGDEETRRFYECMDRVTTTCGSVECGDSLAHKCVERDSGVLWWSGDIIIITGYFSRTLARREP